MLLKLSCLNDIVAWMHRIMLIPNSDKTDVIIFASHRNDDYVTVCESNINSS